MILGKEGSTIWAFINEHIVSDNVWQITNWELIIRMILATVLGGLIGIEREWNNHAAGFRTHILVCLGSTMIMLLSMYGFSDFVNEFNVRLDPARLAAQVVSGIGFLGAGAILRNGNIVTGLTTAASVWVVAAIGLCVGAGFYVGSLFCTFLLLISLHLFNRWEKRWLKNRRFHELEMIILDQPGALGSIIQTLGEYGAQINNLKMNPTDNYSPDIPNMATMAIELKLKTKKPEKLVEAFERIASMEIVISMDAKQFVIQKSGSMKGNSLSR